MREWFVSWNARIPNSILALPAVQGLKFYNIFLKQIFLENMRRALISMNEAAHGMTITDATLLPLQLTPVPAPPPVHMPQ